MTRLRFAPDAVICFHLVVAVAMAASVAAQASVAGTVEPLPAVPIAHSFDVTFSYQMLKGLGPEEGVTRRDPSDVIRWNGRYYVWYTKTTNGYSGYNATIWSASSRDGLEWRELDEALARGPKGAWDSFSVFTPNILKARGRYYLFYTAVKPTPGNPKGLFENNSTTDITAIGVAIADTPEGPFQRVGPKPVLEVSVDPKAFDSYRVDDACLLYRDGRYWLYYKGRSRQHGAQGPRHTRMGVAFAERPEGPYRKHPGNPITNSGHEVMVWPYRGGVMTLLSAHGPEGRTLQFAPDGLFFRIVGRFGDDYPRAPGSYRSGDFADAAQQTGGIHWGISMNYGGRTAWPHLLRYEIEIVPLEEKAPSPDVSSTGGVERKFPVASSGR